MNAPWSPSRPGVAARDPFSAYVCDEMTADALRPVCIEMGWQIEKIHKGGLRNAVQSLSVSASPNILFVDLSESGDPLNDINSLAEVCEPGTVVIAAGEVNDVRLYRDLVASGIQDYLLKPFSADQLRDSFANAQLTISGPRLTESASEKPNVMAAVLGAIGPEPSAALPRLVLPSAALIVPKMRSVALSASSAVPPRPGTRRRPGTSRASARSATSTTSC